MQDDRTRRLISDEVLLHVDDIEDEKWKSR
jgi:hypothetical protein